MFVGLNILNCMRKNILDTVEPIIIRECSIFVVFVDNQPPHIYNLDKNKFRNSWFITETENRHIYKMISQQIFKKHCPRKLPPTPNSNQSTVLPYCDVHQINQKITLF